MSPGVISTNSPNPPGYNDYIYEKSYQDHFSSRSSRRESVTVPNEESLHPSLWTKLYLFLDNTTAHGAKRILIARTRYSRWFWILLVLFGVSAFSFVVMSLTQKYNNKEKITSISLKFDQVDFPAITFCNLNPYKRSLINMVPSIRDTMDVYDNAKSHSKIEKGKQKKKPKYMRRQFSEQSAMRVRQLFEKEIEEGERELKQQRTLFRSASSGDLLYNVTRQRRQTPRRRYEAIEAHCKCVGKPDMECIRFETPPKNNNSKCVCTFDSDLMVAWPCFNSSIWYDHVCPFCTEEGYCEAQLSDKNVPPMDWPCKCRNRTGHLESGEDTPYCIGKEPIVIRKLWVDDNSTTSTTTSTTSTTTTLPPTTTMATTTTAEPTTTTSTTTTTTTTSTTTTTTPVPTTTTTEMPTTPSPINPNQRAIVSNPETIKAFGFSGMTDGVAMLTKAKENLMFTMAALSEEQRIALSQSKHEFIEMCSFNGQECDIDQDFRLHVDPEFGNCFTFNYDIDNNYTSSRAGPMYGIRVLLFVNTSDYMSTSESSGVRLAIHPPTQYPFPDTFGYSAPVGFASSFGMKKKIMHRLNSPPGECVIAREVDQTDYIYHGYDYQPEGCHRSCFQNKLLDECSCGDPRFPVPPENRHCSAFNATARDCLASKIGHVGDFHHITDDMSDCICKHSCTEVLHEVTFSASKWPSGATDLGDCDGMTEGECEQYYRLNAAMVEVFYEQLNYELLQESEAYGMVNLIADFGGHLGLWLGFSMITVTEFFVLIVDCLSVCLSSRREKKLERINTLRREREQQDPEKQNGRKDDAA
ncbi:unnamed protein product [Auanema sp. JU1783]|nr:unnamed protein product [Auanema sp. JU1783]